MKNQQTFIQRFSSTGYKPVTREAIADALERIVVDLRRPFTGDPDDSPNCPHILWNQRFEINGYCWMGNTPEEGFIHLTVQNP